jgi:hypothetical protein
MEGRVVRHNFGLIWFNNFRGDLNEKVYNECQVMAKAHMAFGEAS